MTGVAQFADAGKMTEVEYDQRREAIRATYGDNAKERRALFEQALAILMSQWQLSQDRLAAKEGMSPQQVAEWQRFGHFLTDSGNTETVKNLTHGKFHGFWKETDKNAHITVRFAAVRKRVVDNLRTAKAPIKKKEIADAILATSADGEWHRLATIVERAQFPEEDVSAVLHGMETEGTYKTLCEKRKGGTSYSYRIVRGHGRKVDADVLLHEVQPIIRALESEGRKHIAKASPATIAKLAYDLRTVVERLAHEALRPGKRRSADEGE